MPVARTTDPETSHAAAASVGDVRLSQAAVARVLKTFGPLTDEDLVLLYEQVRLLNHLPAQSPSGIRTRRAELVRLGLVEYTGEKGTISSGRQARKWRVRED